MEFWLSWQNNKERLRLPVLPSNFEVFVANLNTQVNISEIGTINLIGKTDLRAMTIEIFFPDQEYSFCEYTGFPKPYDCIEMIEGWRKSGKPIRVIITDTNINIAFAIESFSYGEDDGSGDVYFSLELAEYVFTKVKQQAVKEYKSPSNIANVSNSKARPEEKEVPKTYTVKKGDTLSAIAKITTGNASNYQVIAKKNNIKNPNLIHPGMVLKI